MSNEPLITRANIITVITVLSAALIHTNHGAISAWLGANADFLAGAVLTLAPLATAVLSRKHVTPVANPKAADGTPLVPATVGLAATTAAQVAQINAAYAGIGAASAAMGQSVTDAVLATLVPAVDIVPPVEPAAAQ